MHFSSPRPSQCSRTHFHKYIKDPCYIIQQFEFSTCLYPNISSELQTQAFVACVLSLRGYVSYPQKKLAKLFAQAGRKSPTFRRNLLSTSSGQKSEYGNNRLFRNGDWQLSKRLHCVTPHKAIMFKLIEQTKKILINTAPPSTGKNSCFVFWRPPLRWCQFNWRSFIHCFEFPHCLQITPRKLSPKHYHHTHKFHAVKLYLSY